MTSSNGIIATDPLHLQPASSSMSHRSKSTSMPLALACSILIVGLPLANTVRGDPSADVAAKGWTPIPASGVISAPGKYFLERDIETNREKGIEVRASDVVVDLRGFALRFQDAPRVGTFGISATGRNNITIRNGELGGFWFNTHLSQCENLSIENVAFDDVAYIGVNVAGSKHVRIDRNRFVNFRYDIEKPRDKYLIGINIGAEDVVISNNHFHARPPRIDPQSHDIETVFVLLSARVSRRCIVGLNQMTSDRPLPRGYGIWVAKDAQATVAYNKIRNMKYAICLATDGNATICHNQISAQPPVANEPFDSYGVFAKSPADLTMRHNVLDSLSHPAFMPAKLDPTNIVKARTGNPD